MTDHRINLTIYNLPNILDGNIHDIISQLQMAENAERLKVSALA
jgi:peptide chain release factor 1